MFAPPLSIKAPTEEEAQFIRAHNNFMNVLHNFRLDDEIRNDLVYGYFSTWTVDLLPLLSRPEDKHELLSYAYTQFENWRQSPRSLSPQNVLRKCLHSMLQWRIEDLTDDSSIQDQWKFWEEGTFPHLPLSECLTLAKTILTKLNGLQHSSAENPPPTLQLLEEATQTTNSLLKQIFLKHIAQFGEPRTFQLFKQWIKTRLMPLSSKNKSQLLSAAITGLQKCWTLERLKDHGAYLEQMADKMLEDEVDTLFWARDPNKLNLSQYKYWRDDQLLRLPINYQNIILAHAKTWFKAEDDSLTEILNDAINYTLWLRLKSTVAEAPMSQHARKNLLSEFEAWRTEALENDSISTTFLSDTMKIILNSIPESPTFEDCKTALLRLQEHTTPPSTPTPPAQTQDKPGHLLSAAALFLKQQTATSPASPWSISSVSTAFASPKTAQGTPTGNSPAHRTAPIRKYSRLGTRTPSPLLTPQPPTPEPLFNARPNRQRKITSAPSPTAFYTRKEQKAIGSPRPVSPIETPATLSPDFASEK